MAHQQQRFFIHGVRQFLPEFFSHKSVLEVGSLNINGSVREFFEECRYVGLDVADGKDVDIACPGEDYGEKASSFDTVISCEAMEHNPQWRKTWLNMLRVVKDDGLVLMSCATTGRKQHGTEQYNACDSPLTFGKGQNYYLNLVEQDFSGLVSCDQWFSVWAFFVDHTNHDLYFYGLGNGATSAQVEKATQLRAAFADHYYKLNVLGIQ